MGDLLGNAVRFSASATVKHITSVNRLTATETDVVVAAGLSTTHQVARSLFLGAQALAMASGANQTSEETYSLLENRTNFARSDLRDVNAYGAVFSSASFAGADLTHASLVGTYLEGANFSGARLDGTNFSGAEMDRAVGLSQAQLNQACGDASTQLPRGLRIPAC